MSPIAHLQLRKKLPTTTITPVDTEIAQRPLASVVETLSKQDRRVPAKFRALTPLSAAATPNWQTMAVRSFSTSADQVTISQTRIMRTFGTPSSMPLSTSLSSVATTAIPSTVLDLPANPAPPVPPAWFIGILVAWMAFGAVCAVILFFAQFPHTLAWFDLQSYWWWRATVGGRRGYQRVGQRDDEDDSSAVATSSNFATGSMEENGYRRRKPKHLRINTGSATSVATEGLGIELPVDGDQQRKRLSWDERIHASHQSQTATPRPTKNSFFTAPLPSKRHFIATRNNDDSSDDEIIRAPDIETGHPMPDRDLEDDYSRKRPSPYFKDAVEEQEVDDQKRGAFLKAVNRGVYKMTDRLSATFFDEVTGAEDGLVLPVRECERS